MIDEELKQLVQEKEHQKPFIAEKESELQKVDAEYLEIHDVQEAFQHEKTTKMDIV